MPEGDTIFLAARTLHRYLAGKAVTRFESVFPLLNRLAEDKPVVGRQIDSIAARGKHLLFTFSGDLVLRTHMRMNGSWHIYPVDARWKRPAHQMRLLVGTRKAVAVGFNIPTAEFIAVRDIVRHKPLQSLGPDLLDPAFDPAEALRRMRARKTEAIADVLIDQHVVAGAGNVFKSEVLFAARIHPFTAAAFLSDEQLRRVVDVAREQLRTSVFSAGQTLGPAVGRRTTKSLNPNEKLWVYGRAGRPCRVCGENILSRASGFAARLTYWCPACQPAPDRHG